ncbi:MAG: hypothetical protein WBQ16_08070 [Nitrososphaeraceae archaeon]
MPLVPLYIVHNIILNGTDKGKGGGCLFSPRRIEETGHNQRRREPQQIPFKIGGKGRGQMKKGPDECVAQYC